MKAYTKLFVTALGLSALLYSCGPEKVAPRNDDQSNSPTLGLSEDHPIINPLCSGFDTLGLIDQASGSTTVNYQCTSNCPQWGSVTTYNSIEFFVATFRLSTNWVIDVANSNFALLADFQFGTGGVPVITTDWDAYSLSPDPNSWQLVVLQDSIDRDDANCFAFSTRIRAVRRTFLGGIITGSPRNLWAYNDEWNVQGSDKWAPSPYVTPYCWSFCPPPADTICVPYITGLPNSAGVQCVTLTPDVSGITSAVAYAWSTGATTPSISVCPTSDMEVSVTVTTVPGREPVIVNSYQLTANDARCYAGNSPHHKVWVCHNPPGNPANQQDICIDWSGVPAHVARFRGPNYNPRHGHDSGCEIGRCGYNPCD